MNIKRILIPLLLILFMASMVAFGAPVYVNVGPTTEFDGDIKILSEIVAEGTTPDDWETTVFFTDPTADRTITIPDADVTLGVVTGIVPADHGGTGIANNVASTITITGAFATTITVTNVTAVTLPTSGIIVSDATDCTDIEGTGLSIAGGVLNWACTVNGIDSDNYTDNSIDHEHLHNDVIHGMTVSVLAAADEFLFWDDSSGALRKITWTNLMGSVSSLGGITGAIATATNISMTGELDMTGASAFIDLNPANTGTSCAISIIPTATLVATSGWEGICIDGDALDPLTGGASFIHALHADFSGVLSADGNDAVCSGTYILLPTGDTASSWGHAQALTEMTVAGTQIGYGSLGAALVLSVTATYRGVWIDYDGITRDANAPILEGIRVELPADYTAFGANFAAYFTGGGETLTICDGTYALNVGGDILLSANNITLTGYIGRDTDNFIGWAVDDSLAIEIGNVAHAIVDIEDGAGDNDSLVTQGYVDDAVAGGGATVALDNLAAVQINTSLLSDAADTDDLGTAAAEWRSLYIGTAGKIYLGLSQEVALEVTDANTLAITASSNVDFSGGLDVTAGIIVGGNITSDTEDTDDLGSATKEWLNIYVGEAGKIYLRKDQSVNLQATGAGILTLTAANGVVTSAGLSVGGTLAMAANNITLTGYIGRDTDNFIDWTIDDSLTIEIGGVQHDIVDIEDGVGDNDSLVTQGYVDDIVGGANVALSNLAAVAINTTLLPDAADSWDLGAAADAEWLSLYLGTYGTVYFGVGQTENIAETAVNELTITSTTVAISGILSMGANNITTTGKIGRDATTDFISFAVDNTLTIEINNISHAIVSITDGVGDNDKLVTQGYVDDIVGGATIQLDNLNAVAVNVDISSDAADTDSLGSATKEWLNLYIGDAGKILLGLGQTVELFRSAANTLTITASTGVLLTGPLGVTGTRVSKGWFAALESTADITINGTALAATYAVLGANADITSMTGLTTPLAANYGGTGVANGAGETITLTGDDAITFTTTAATNVTLPTAGTLMANVLEDTTPQLGGDVDSNNLDYVEVKTVQFNSLYAIGNSGATETVDWQNGAYQSITIDEACVISFSNEYVGTLTIEVTYGGNFALTFDGGITLLEEGGTEIVTTDAVGVDFLIFKNLGTADEYIMGALLDVKD